MQSVKPILHYILSCPIYKIHSEPVELTGEGLYNLNSLKEIKVTDSYLEIPEAVRDCQSTEPYYNCTTRLHLENIRKKCGCLPLALANIDKV